MKLKKTKTNVLRRNGNCGVQVEYKWQSSEHSDLVHSSDVRRHPRFSTRVAPTPCSQERFIAPCSLLSSRPSIAGTCLRNRFQMTSLGASFSRGRGNPDPRESPMTTMSYTRRRRAAVAYVSASSVLRICHRE